MALAAIYDWEIEQIDFVGAFLNTDLRESIYMETPEGFKLFVAYFVENKPKILKLLKQLGYNSSMKQIILLAKALYGLKQSPREWQLKFKTFFEELGFKNLVLNSTVFFDSKNGIFIVTFVDDCLLIGPKIRAINVIKAQITKQYAIEDRRPATYFLDVQIIRDRTKRLL